MPSLHEPKFATKKWTKRPTNQYFVTLNGISYRAGWNEREFYAYNVLERRKDGTSLFRVDADQLAVLNVTLKEFISLSKRLIAKHYRENVIRYERKITKRL